MPQKGHSKSHHHTITKSRQWLESYRSELKTGSASRIRPKLEFVLKCDSAGSVEAVTAGVLNLPTIDAEISIIRSGVGYINYSDILMAETSGRLIVGFQIDALPGIDIELNMHSVEVRLYDVIYTLISDIKRIAESMVTSAEQEVITGTARVVALFKSTRKGIIAGCEVLKGNLAYKNHFRIISEMGPVYAGIIESMHIENDVVQKAHSGQRAGIKIVDFSRVKVGDIVECFRPAPIIKALAWQPKGEIIRRV